MVNPNLLNWENIPVEKLPDNVERQMIVGENIMICRVKLPALTVTTPHEHLHEQMTLIEKGRAAFIIGDKEITVGAGDILHFPPNKRHGATMLDEDVVLIDIFSPIREDFLSR